MNRTRIAVTILLLAINLPDALADELSNLQALIDSTYRVRLVIATESEQITREPAKYHEKFKEIVKQRFETEPEIAMKLVHGFVEYSGSFFKYRPDVQLNGKALFHREIIYPIEIIRWNAAVLITAIEGNESLMRKIEDVGLDLALRTQSALGLAFSCSSLPAFQTISDEEFTSFVHRLSIVLQEEKIDSDTFKMAVVRVIHSAFQRRRNHSTVLPRSDRIELNSTLSVFSNEISQKKLAVAESQAKYLWLHPIKELGETVFPNADIQSEQDVQKIIDDCIDVEVRYFSPTFVVLLYACVLIACVLIACVVARLAYLFFRFHPSPDGDPAVAWLDQRNPNFFSRQHRRALVLIRQAYPNQGQLMEIASLSGLQLDLINPNAVPRFLAMEIYRRAAAEGKLRVLISEILADQASKGIHSEIWLLLENHANEIRNRPLLNE